VAAPGPEDGPAQRNGTTKWEGIDRMKMHRRCQAKNKISRGLGALEKPSGSAKSLRDNESRMRTLTLENGTILKHVTRRFVICATCCASQLPEDQTHAHPSDVERVCFSTFICLPRAMKSILSPLIPQPQPQPQNGRQGSHRLHHRRGSFHGPETFWQGAN
jgi:hypothetical protein